jgi:hypothetical protein
LGKAHSDNCKYSARKYTHALLIELSAHSAPVTPLFYFIRKFPILARSSIGAISLPLKYLHMKSIFLIVFSILTATVINAQFVAKVEIKEPVKGLCNDKEVYSLFPGFTGQKEAICPVSDEEISKRLDSAVTFLKDNPKYKDKGMIGIMINCKGEVVKCEMDNKTKDATLDNQIVAVFAALGQWQAGQLNGKPVDSMRLFSFEIKKGKLSLN